MPRIDSRKCSLDGTKGKNKTDLSTSSKWQIDHIFVVEGSPARCVSERSKGGDYAPGDSKGHSPWRAFGDFPRVGKVTRGGGAERPPGGFRGYRLRINPPGAGRSACITGGAQRRALPSSHQAQPCVKGESHPCRPCTSAAAPGCGPNRRR